MCVDDELNEENVYMKMKIMSMIPKSINMELDTRKSRIKLYVRNETEPDTSNNFQGNKVVYEKRENVP